MYVQWIKGELREGKNNFIVCSLQTKLPLCYHHFMSPRRTCNFVNLLGLGLCEKEILFCLYVLCHGLRTPNEAFFQWYPKLLDLGAVHKGRPQIFPYFWPLPPSCLQPSAIQGPLPKKDVCKLGIWPPPLNFQFFERLVKFSHAMERQVGTTRWS